LLSLIIAKKVLESSFQNPTLRIVEVIL